MKNPLAARPVEELEELFYWCTANDNVLIINIPPDQTGKIHTNEKLRIFELADRLGIRGGKSALPSGPKNLSFNLPVVASSFKINNHTKMVSDSSLDTYWEAADTTTEITIDFEKEVTWDRLSILGKGEMLDLGDFFSKIRKFNIKEFDIQVYNQGIWDTF